MNKLVEVKKNEIYTDSLIYAEKFGIPHRNLLIKIRELAAVGSAPKNYFISDKYINKQQREYERYLISEEGFMFLVMNTKASPDRMKYIWEIQLLFIKAFKKMQQQLLRIENNKSNLEWAKTREQGKSIRLSLTDTIKEFVEYATSQGSKSAKLYYMNITKMEYKALGLMQENVPSLRSNFDTMELYQLLMAEDLVKISIEKNMELGKHYKEIYLLAKIDLERYINVLKLN